MEAWQVAHENFCLVAKRRCGVDADEMKGMRETKRLNVFHWLGFVAMPDYVEHVFGYAPHTAKERLRVAEALASLPHLSKALEEGLVNFSVVRELTRVATSETEEAWFAAADGMVVREVEELVSGHAKGDLPSSPTKPDLRKRRISIDLSPESFALFREARLVLEKEHGGHVDDEQVLVALCKGLLEGKRERAQHQVAVTICKECKRGWQQGGGRSVEIGQKQIERACCDAEDIGDLEGGAHANQDVTPKTRRIVEHRDHGQCRVPSCRAAYGIEIHHIIQRQHGGSHEADNLLLLCSAHHTALHEGRLVIHGDATNARFERPVLDAATRAMSNPLPRETKPESIPKPIPRGMLPSIPRVPPEAIMKSEADPNYMLVVGALTHSGFKPKEARILAERARSHVGEDSAQAWLKRAFKLSPSAG